MGQLRVRSGRQHVTSPGGRTVTARRAAVIGLVSLGLAVPGAPGAVSAVDADPEEVVLGATAVAGSTAPEQEPTAVAARLDRAAGSTALGKRFAAVVLDPGTGKTLFGEDADAGRIPASGMKLLTAAAALTQMGADTRLATRTALEPGTGNVFLIGGGDPMLASRPPVGGVDAPDYPAATSMKKLAKETAAGLRAAGKRKVRLRYDASLFTGPALRPEWPKNFGRLGIVAPVQALMVDHGGTVPGGPRAADPARMAALRFAELLGQRGIKVRKVAAGTVPDGAERLAVVESVPVRLLVAQMLTHSDNDVAEALFRHAGLASGGAASFAGGATAVAGTLAGMGIDADGVTIRDGSGLSRSNRVTPRLLAELLVRVVREEESLSPIGDGLAVAGLTGTLRWRFNTPVSSRPAGLLYAKTGTLNGVSSLSGFVRSRSGRVLVFSAIANKAESTVAARQALDRFATKVAACGCP